MTLHAAPRTLSKSDYALARDCSGKLWFRENGFRSSDAGNEYLRLLAWGGYMVEALARAKRAEGIYLEKSASPEEDFGITLELLARENVTLFQATLLSDRRLARVDILEKRGNDFRLIEVKAKSFDGAAHFDNIAKGGRGEFRGKRKPYALITKWIPKLEDLTFQTILLRRLFPKATITPCLMLVDTSKRSTIDDLPSLFTLKADRTISAHFTGSAEQLDSLDLLTEVVMTDEVAELTPSVDTASSYFESLLDAPFQVPLTERGAKCDKCEFHPDGFALCWGELAHVTPHMLDLFSIGSVSDANGGPLVSSLANAGKASLFDIPEQLLVKKDGTVGPMAERQLRQIRHTRSGEPWISLNLASKLDALAYPLHFIDFEAARLSMPYHAGMRPYGQVAFQWSVHTVDTPGATPRHTEWLNEEYTWPNVSFAHRLRDVIGDVGSVLTWSGFEESSLNATVAEHQHFVGHDAALVDWVRHLVDTRLFDLHTCAQNDFYHPEMGGRTSIKVVMDALWKSDPRMREQFTEWTGVHVAETTDPYHALPPLVIAGVEQQVREGTGAIRAYEAMMYGAERGDAEIRRAWRELLLQYCKLDTLSMVLVFEHWKRCVA